MASENNNSDSTVPSLYQQFKACAEQQPEKTAIVFQQQSLSYAQLLQLADTIASNLVAAINTDSAERNSIPVVALHYRNSPELVATLLAIARLGWTAVMLNISLRSQQLVRQIEALSVELVVSSSGGVATLGKQLAADSLCPMPSLLCSTDSVLPKSSPNINGDFIVTMSSGSTSAPKPIALSQRCKWLRSQQAARDYRVTKEDVVLCASPIHHSLGQRLSLLPLLRGGTLVLLEHFSTEAWLEAVVKHHVSFTIAVSSHLQALRESLLAADSSLDSLRCLVTSSAQIDEQLKRQLTEGLGCEFHEMYGATEVATVTDFQVTEMPEKMASVGKVLADIDVQILDGHRAVLPVGEVGEIAVCSPLRFNGYFNQPQLTTVAMHDHYFLTGDLGCLDEDGFLYFRSRAKDIIISGGINIVPTDIEAVLTQHELIESCVVIARHDDYLGEVVLAVCVPVRELSEQELLSLKLFSNQHLAGFQQPRDYQFLSELPVTASGKIDKQTLRERYSGLVVGDAGD